MEITKPSKWTIFQTVIWLYVAGALLWYGFFEKPFLHYVNLPFPIACGANKCSDGVRPQPITAGHAVSIFVERCSSSKEERTYAITHALTNVATQDRVLLPSDIVAIRNGCFAAVSRVNIVPPDTPPGTYYVSGFAEVAGTFRSFLVPWRSQPFEVVR